jgi:hypothetical protein
MGIILWKDNAMTKPLEKAFSEATKLSPEEQDALAHWILEELASERRWEQAFAESRDVLAKLADEALAEYRSGKPKNLTLINKAPYPYGFPL